MSVKYLNQNMNNLSKYNHQTTCLNIFERLSDAVDQTNYELIDRMTDPDMKYDLVCVKPDVTYDHYYKVLRKRWNGIVSGLVNNPNRCNTLVSNLLSVYDLAESGDLINLVKSGNLESVNIEDTVLNAMASVVMSKASDGSFDLKENFAESFYGLARVLSEYCYCQSLDIFKAIVGKYRKKYSIKFQGKSKEEVKQLLKTDYDYLKNLLQTSQVSDFNVQNKNVIKDISDKLTGAYSFSVESELDKLIPNELGSLKDFFVKVISTYYQNLHPIVWAQIYKQMANNIFVDLPFSQDEFFRFASKQTLLNSGPFILKILQLIRPILSPELKKKYNLDKLPYPQLTPEQVELILGKIVMDWPMYNIWLNVSASVGHVCIVSRADNPNDKFIIKIIKPLAIAQSCWEYKTLYDIYPEGSCERAFLIGLMNAIGTELNVENEKKNIDDGHKFYPETYESAFGVPINMKLDTIQVIHNVIKPDCWFALATTLAPGIPLNYLVENDILKSDTPYRAKLHRGLDILVYKFFLTIIKHGYYHGDLHAGNIFYSYLQSQLTLIDFGAVGHLDIYSGDPYTRKLLDIIILSLFYNYDQIFDEMTVLLNSKCPENSIDPNTPQYRTMKSELSYYHLQNIMNEKREAERTKQFREDIFSPERIKAEEMADKTVDMEHYKRIESIYSYLEIKPIPKETVVENTEILPPFTEVVGDAESVTFAKILESIIKFYAVNGVNVAIKFNEFYEFQKAYALLLGVLHQVGYNTYRANIAIGRAVKRLGNIPELAHLSTVSYASKIYWRERDLYKKIIEELGKRGEI